MGFPRAAPWFRVCGSKCPSAAATAAARAWWRHWRKETARNSSGLNGCWTTDRYWTRRGCGWRPFSGNGISARFMTPSRPFYRRDCGSRPWTGSPSVRIVTGGQPFPGSPWPKRLWNSWKRWAARPITRGCGDSSPMMKKRCKAHCNICRKKSCCVTTRKCCAAPGIRRNAWPPWPSP